jgi:hypothetical protein
MRRRHERHLHHDGQHGCDTRNHFDGHGGSCGGAKRIEFKVDEYGGLLLRQYCWPDQDQEIYVNGDYIDLFLDKLTDVAGIPSVGRSS